MSLKGNVRKFCDDSTIHGFKELYYANCFWKLFWTLVILGAAAVTSYQVYDAYDTFQKQPTVVNVYPLRENIVKPNIDFCFHVKYVWSWMTLDNTILNDKTDDYFMYLLSKITNVTGLDVYYSNASIFNSTCFNCSRWFNYTENRLMADINRKNYYDMLANNNVTNEAWFARKFVGGSPNVDIIPINKALSPIQRIIQKITFAGDYVCYSYSLNNIDGFEIKFLEPTVKRNVKEGLGTVTMNMLRDTYPGYFYGMNPPSKAPSPLDVSIKSNTVMFGIGNLQPFVLKSYTIYDIQLSASKLILSNSAANPCSKGDGILSYLLMELPTQNNLKGNYSCYNLCMYKKHKKTENGSGCCTVDKVFGLQEDKNLALQLCGGPEGLPAQCGSSAGIDEECQAECPEPCKQWVYFSDTQKETNVGLSGLTTSSSMINIKFPYPFSIMVSEESAAYTWTTLVGSIGGLLGLWLGASLLSFLQTIYLLLFTTKTAVEEITPNDVRKKVEQTNK